MNWLSANWIWVLLIGGMLAMHLGMHRGHDGHEHMRHPAKGQRNEAGNESHHADGSTTETPTGNPVGSHRHRGC
jgi:hypothetical protein